MEKKEDTLTRLAAIFTQMVDNAATPDRRWQNIALAREAFVLMNALPDVLPGEYETAAEKADLLDRMLDQLDEFQVPRFCISVRREMARLNPADENNGSMLQQLRDFIDESLPMEEYCLRYRRMLRFDPVERSARYEQVIADVEAEIAEELEDLPRGMGFCFAYWNAKSKALYKRGIAWSSPHLMNPGVMFD